MYIVELTPPFERLEIQFVPESIPWSRTANISDIAVVGRNHPRRHHTGGDESISLELDFFAHDQLREDTMKKVNWLVSLTYNQQDQGAPKVKLVWGKLFQDHVWLVSRVQPILSNFHSLYDMLPVQSAVRLELKLDPEENQYLEDVRS